MKIVENEKFYGNFGLTFVLIFLILFLTIFLGKTFDFSIAKAKWDIKQKAIELHDGKVPFIESSKNLNGIDYGILNELNLRLLIARVNIRQFYDPG